MNIPFIRGFIIILKLNAISEINSDCFNSVFFPLFLCRDFYRKSICKHLAAWPKSVQSFMNWCTHAVSCMNKIVQIATLTSVSCGTTSDRVSANCEFALFAMTHVIFFYTYSCSSEILCFTTNWHFFSLSYHILLCNSFVVMWRNWE